MSNGEITVTLVFSETGQSESIGVHEVNTKLSDLLEWSVALFGLSQSKSELQLAKDGQLLVETTTTTSMSLQQAGIRHGDVVAVQPKAASRRAAAPYSAATTSTGGLDFSSLLASPPASAPAASSSSAAPRGVPVYFPGMSFDEAMQYNPHPSHMVQLLFTHEHLLKELNYHSPQLAQEITKHRNNPQQASTVWREYLVKGGIQAALRHTQKFHTEQTMKDRLAKNPNDQEAKEYFASKENEQLIHQQYQSMMQEYPESMGRVLMLYISAKVNHHDVQAFVDSGAQSTIMSKRCARKCEILHLVDKRFAGVAVGVGKGKIMGRIHIVQLQIDNNYFPCSITVMDDEEGLGDKNMDFLLGLDMLKRFNCNIDLEKGVLRFRLGPNEHMDTPFLHEKDLDETKGGTRGFDADKANEELMREMKKRREEGDGDNGDSAMD